MSASDEAVMMCCASCGTAEVDDVKLKGCADCDLVRYCSDNCQQEHRPKHEAICKKRAAELRDEILFRQPESTQEGDCPICFLPLPITIRYSNAERPFIQMSCCIQEVCNGCYYANKLREREMKLQQKCPFCRHPRPKSKEEIDMNRMKRVAAKDPAAIEKMGVELYYKGDYSGAFEYLTQAAELGNVNAHYNLSVMYRKGEGVEKDEKRGTYHLEEAAIAGHVGARYNLACYERRNKRFKRAAKHLIIAANLGCDKSIKSLKKCYVNGDVSKEDFAAALRAHQAAADAMKSPQREAAAKAIAAGELRFV